MTCVNVVTMFSQGLTKSPPGIKYKHGVIGVKKEYKPLYEQFGLNVVYYRKKRKMTQLQLAELADVDRSHISAIELGNVGVSMDVIFKLSEVLDIAPKDLFDFRD